MRTKLFLLLSTGLAALALNASAVAQTPATAAPCCPDAVHATLPDPTDAASRDALRKGGSASGVEAERRAALSRLIAAADAYAHAVGLYEIDPSASGVAAEQAEKRAFRRTLEGVVARTAQPSLVSYGEADGALNATYAEVMAAKVAWGGIAASGIRRTERVWLAYRDAFVAFAATLNQDGAADRIKTELTERRTNNLEAFLAD